MSPAAPTDIHTLYQRYGPMVLRRCRSLLHDEALAEDAMQDVFMRLLKRKDPLQPTGVSSLLFQMATQVSLNRMRTARRHPEHPGEGPLLSIAGATDVEADVGSRGLLGTLFRAEPVSTRVMAVMHLHDGMTLDEVAEATGLSVSGVRKRLRTLRHKLQTLAPQETRP